MKVLRKGEILLDDCLFACSFWSRTRGYIGKKEISTDEGIFFVSCNSVHMWFMSASLDLIFLRKTGDRYLVSSYVENVKPWAILPLSDFKASETLEVASGLIRAKKIRQGDELCIA